MKNLLKNIIRITISGGVLFFVLRRINFSEIQQLLKDANVGIFSLSFLVYGVMMALCALRWHRLLYVQKVSLPYKRTLAYYLIGFFYNNILPTVIGGGVVRALYAGKAKNKNKEAFSSMLAELVIGGWGLLIFVLIASLFWLRKLSLYKIILPFFGGLVLSTAFLYLFFEREVMKKLGSITQRIKIFGINNKIKEFYESLYIYKDKKLLLIESVFLSFGVQALIGLMNFLIGISLGFKLPIMSYIIYPVIIGLLTAIPITINGLGIREWGYSFFFAQVGLTSSSAVILSLLFYFVGVIGSLAGAFVFPFVKFSKVKDE